MTTSAAKPFRFATLDASGATSRQTGLLGKVGIAEKYHGAIQDCDELVIAIRKAVQGQSLDDHQHCLLRSFLFAWLSGSEKRLGAVAGFAIELPASVSYLAQIGFLDRTVNAIGKGAIAVAGVLVFLDLTWEAFAAAPDETSKILASSLAADAALMVIPDRIFTTIDTTFGEVGKPVERKSFSPEPIVSFLQLCRFRSALRQLHCEPALQASLTKMLDQRIFALLLANSRQIEGLSLSGTSEASAAVAAHAAIALGLSELPNVGETLSMLEKAARSVPSESRASEVARTIETIRQNIKNDFSDIERQLNRQLASASTTEAVELMVTPVGISFQLIGMVAGTMKKYSPAGHFETIFAAVESGCQLARKTSDAAPDALASAIDRGISVESWSRQTMKKLWPFGS